MRIEARHPVTLLCGLLLCAPGANGSGPLSAPDAPCRQGEKGGVPVTGPTPRLAWRAGLLGQTDVFRGIPGAGGKRWDSIEPREAPWLLILRAVAHAGHCWVKVRLPSRPNDAAGWLDARRLQLRRSAWRIVVSRAARTLTVHRGGIVVRRARGVVGAPATPTPKGLFSIVGAWRSPPDAFVGSWILGLTAHSNALRAFGGGEGRVGIHGRGGASLLDPLGTAASHGCIRLANRAIGWIAQTIGPGQIPGIPVLVR